MQRLDRDEWGPADEALAESAGAEEGHVWCEATTHPAGTGVSPYGISARDGARVTTNDGYLDPARERENLRVLGGATSTRSCSRQRDSFAERWPDDFPRGKGDQPRSQSTIDHNRERVRSFARAYKGRTLRSIEKPEARQWALEHPGTLPALRAMFTDAIGDGLADDNPFAKLGFAQRRGREDIVVLTETEAHALCDIARRHFGGKLGEEVAAMIIWAAYTCTCMRSGETFGARYGHLDGDLYDVRTQVSLQARQGDRAQARQHRADLRPRARRARRA